MKSIVVENDIINVNFGESTGKDEYHRCDSCGEKTALASTCGSEWEYDEEPFKADERKSLRGEPGVKAEITGHYCAKCRRLTSLCINIY